MISMMMMMIHAYEHTRVLPACLPTRVRRLPLPLFLFLPFASFPFLFLSLWCGRNK